MSIGGGMYVSMFKSCLSFLRQSDAFLVVMLF